MASVAFTTDTGMDLRDLLSDSCFSLRARRQRHPNREVDALRRLAAVFAHTPEIVLQELCDIAVESCGADSAGVSLEVPTEERFRWVAIAGSFANFLHGTTPRFYSPCGTCLDRNAPQLYRVTKPYYDYLGIEAEPIADGLLIPWVAGTTRGTLWMVSHSSSEAFDLEDYSLLRSLADFAAMAVRHRSQQEALMRQAEITAAAAMANDLAHQINNPLQSLTNTIYLASISPEQMLDYVEKASAELEVLSLRVRQLLNLRLSGKVET